MTRSELWLLILHAKVASGVSMDASVATADETIDAVLQRYREQLDIEYEEDIDD